MKLTAKEVMSKEFETISLDAPVMEAVERILKGKVRESGFRTISLMVTDSMGRLAGVVSMLDILYHMRPPFFNYMDDNAGMDMDDVSLYIDRFKGLSVKHVMTIQTSGAYPEENILPLIDQMVRKKVRRLPVLEDGILVGVVYITEVYRKICQEWLGAEL
ncbi:CBS domain-containing protein [Desulfatibacillum alkenivorans DSM 16219]|jgi:CBS-domain-containing membrane protein|uniref:CBS domain-containing protein n=1 Tax=Desulfatibacillum alkenivorans DSM 16219 TaxID=1121393 RepID=A0A1M6S4N8_9BACT|nr:CBS domain-containing protein [Desulfatibacillum alkenivorans]SHK39804.1 CBS domain-containing protein [Desulfatibacillum alkenivorans DSM 16219]